MSITTSLAEFDTDVAKAISLDNHRLESTIDLIASENYTSQAVMQATGSVMTNKYAEGYPHNRYYGGCEHVDTVEELAQKRLLKLFGLDPEKFHANVQPHSGSQANMAAFFTLLNPGDTILGMDLAAGGHLTHGYKINFSGKFYHATSYGVDPTTECLNYDAILTKAKEYKPKLLIVGASAYSRTIDFKQCKEIADTVGAKLLVDMAHIAGLVAVGLHPSPFEYADIVTSTTHKTLRGPRGGIVICKKEYAKQLDRAVMPGIQGGPFMHHIAAKAVAFKEALNPAFKVYQKQVIANAQTMVEEFTKRGYRVVSEKTDNHLFIIDLRNQNITGKIAEEVLMASGITLNKNCIPNDPEKPFVTSGIRIGTPAMTTRGCTQDDARSIVSLIDKALKNYNDLEVLAKIKEEVKVLCAQRPVYRTIKKDINFIPSFKTEQINEL